MPWTVGYDPDQMMVRYCFVGPTTIKDVRDATRGGLPLHQGTDVWDAFVQAKECKALFDVFDLYSLPKFYVRVNLPHKARIALVIPEGEPYEQGFRFYETACVNHGYLVKVFIEDVAAMEWLKGGKRD